MSYQQRTGVQIHHAVALNHELFVYRDHLRE